VSVVRIPPTLRAESGGARQVEASGETVRAVLEALGERHPALGARIFENGGVRTQTYWYSGPVKRLYPSGSVVVIRYLTGTLSSSRCPSRPSSTNGGSTARRPILR